MRRLPHGAACTFVRPAHTEKRLSAFCGPAQDDCRDGKYCRCPQLPSTSGNSALRRSPFASPALIVQRSKRMQRHISPQFHM